jgi:hypothetical protein
MRLLISAVAIVFGFGLGAWGISSLLPETLPAWVGVTLTMVWLFLLIFAVLLISSRSHKEIGNQRRLLGYGLLTAVLMASFLVPLFVYKVHFAEWLAKAVLAAIAGAVFLFSKYMERRKLQRTVR